MTHSYTVQEWAGDRTAAGFNMLAGSGGLFMSIRIDALTCVQITLPVYSFGQEEEEVDRGVHRLGRPDGAAHRGGGTGRLSRCDHFDDQHPMTSSTTSVRTMPLRAALAIAAARRDRMRR